MLLRYKVVVTTSIAILLSVFTLPQQFVKPVAAKELENIVMVEKEPDGLAAEVGKQSNQVSITQFDDGIDVFLPYKISSPDEIDDIAKQFNTSEHLIMQLNGLNQSQLQQEQEANATTETKWVSLSKPVAKKAPVKSVKKITSKPKSKPVEVQKSSVVSSKKTSKLSYKTSTSGYEVGNTVNVKATAYGVAGNEQWGTLTAMGTQCRPGVIAVDPKLIPLGSKVYVSGYSSPHLPKGGFVATAEDTGGAIKGNRIDIFMDEPESNVSNFGIQDIKIQILKK